jgi:excisionase family DNA binding protein
VNALLTIDRTTAGHVAAALRFWIDRLEREGWRHQIPEQLRAIERWTTTVHNGPDGTPLVVSPPDVHAPARAAFTIEETAAMCALSPRTIRRAVTDGTLPSIRIGTARRIRPADLDRWLDHNQDRP